MNDLVKDFMSEKFTKREMVIYGMLVPMALMLIMAIAGWLETL